MITLEALSSDRDPPFHSLDLAIAPGELPAVVCPDEAERLAFVHLLMGQITESGGRVLREGEPLSAKQRRASVTVLPKQAAISPELTVGENIDLVAAVRGLTAKGPLVKKLLAFSLIPGPKVLPSAIVPESRLRLTLALAALGDPALIIALDPPPPVLAILPDLVEPERVLLLVLSSLAGAEAVATRVHSLVEGRLGEGVAGTTAEVKGRRYRLRVAPGPVTPQTLLAHHPGVTVNRLPNGDYLVDVESEVSSSLLIRTLVHAGVAVVALREEAQK